MSSWPVKLNSFAHTELAMDSKNMDPEKHRKMRMEGKWYDGVLHGRHSDEKEERFAPRVVLRERDKYGHLLDEKIPWPTT